MRCGHVHKSFVFIDYGYWTDDYSIRNSVAMERTFWMSPLFKTYEFHLNVELCNMHFTSTKLYTRDARYKTTMTLRCHGGRFSRIPTPCNCVVQLENHVLWANSQVRTRLTAPHVICSGYTPREKLYTQFLTHPKITRTFVLHRKNQ